LADLFEYMMMHGLTNPTFKYQTVLAYPDFARFERFTTRIWTDIFKTKGFALYLRISSV